MAYQERVTTPGKVNSLISFFEKQTDDTPNSKAHLYTEGCYSSSNGKQDLVENYFLEGAVVDGTQIRNGSISVEKDQLCDNSYGKNLQTVHQTERVECVENYSADQNQSVFEDVTISYEQKNNTETSLRSISPNDESEQGNIEKQDIQIDYLCQSKAQEAGSESSEDEKAVEDKLYDLKLCGQENKTEKIVYLGNNLDDTEYRNIQVVKQEQSSQYQEENDQYETESGQYEKENGQYEKENGQYETESGQYEKENGQYEKEADQYERESLSSEDETERIQAQEIGFVKPELIEDFQQDAAVEGQTFAIPYEMLPNHLKGFTAPTVVSASYYDPDADAKRLKKAMKGLGTDEATVIEIIASRSTEQRLEICYSYENLFQKSLVHELEKELSGNFGSVILSLMTSPYEFLASELRRAVKGVGTDEDAIIEILCVYEDQDIIRIKDAYEHLFKKSLKDDIYEDTSGDFRKILLSILATCREDPKAAPSSVAAQLCETDVKGKSILDLDTLRTVLVSYTRPFLYSVFSEYEELAGKTMGDLIKAITSSGETRNALLALYQGIVSLPVFFAKELEASFKGLGTKDSKLIRIVVSRAELDLGDVKEAYGELYHKNLEQEVQKETSGDYKKVLIALLAGNCNSMQQAESNL